MIFSFDKEILGVCFIIGLYLYLNKCGSWFKILWLALTLPGPSAWPVTGNAHIATDSKRIFELANNVYDRYGRLVRGWLSFIPVFFVVEPEDLQKILGTYQNTDKSFFYSLMHTFLGEGLITSNGDKWRQHRKIVQPLFHKNVLESFVNTYSVKSKLLVEELRYDAKNGNDVKITTHVNKLVINILNDTVLGLDSDKQTYEDSTKSPFREGKVLVQERVANPWFLFESIFQFTGSAKEEYNQKQKLYAFTRKLLHKKRTEKNIIGNEGKNKCLLERMMELGKDHPDFTDDDIIEEICTFMLAGQDSVSSAVAFSLYFLAENQEVQARAFEEIKDVLEDFERDVEINDVRKMKYLENCIKEALRLCPSVPLMSRRLSENVAIGDHVLPEGSNIFISPYVTHRLQHIYPEPLKFDPDRFSAENTDARHPFAYLPFSSGPRNCIGYKLAMIEMKTVISTLLKHYHLSVTPGYQFELSFRITLRAKGGIWLRLKPRQTILT